MELAAQLKQSLLFSGLSESDLHALATIAVRRVFSKGESLFSEGDVATGFYLLVSGHIKLCRVSSDGREKVLHFVRPGETFAEAAFAGAALARCQLRCVAPGSRCLLLKIELFTTYQQSSQAQNMLKPMRNERHALLFFACASR